MASSLDWLQLLEPNHEETLFNWNIVMFLCNFKKKKKKKKCNLPTSKVVCPAKAVNFIDSLNYLVMDSSNGRGFVRA